MIKRNAKIYQHDTKWFVRNYAHIDLDKPILNEQETAIMRDMLEAVKQLTSEILMTEARRKEILDRLHAQGFSDEAIEAHMEIARRLQDEDK